MKNKKLNLKDLKVKSFVTDLENRTSETAKGGGGPTAIVCSIEPEFCNFTQNRWCISNGNCNTYEAFCTQTK